jgi:hypothetical protein
MTEGGSDEVRLPATAPLHDTRRSALVDGLGAWQVGERVVTPRTLRNWLDLPAFAAAFKERCKGILETATSALSGATEGAVEALRRNLTCGKAAAEIRAAVGILDHAFKATELLDLMKRLEELERRGTPPNGSITGPDTMRDNGHVAEPETTP